MAVVQPFQAYAATVHTADCEASWYGPGLHGNTMANGQKFNKNDPKTVAHKTIPLGTSVRITNLRNGRSIKAVVRDRGPYVGKRCIDASEAMAKQLGFKDAGKTRVKIELL